MSYLNLNFGLIIYEDQQVTSPQIRSLDVTRSITGVAVEGERGTRVDLLPGESQVVATTQRVLTQDATTQYSISHPWTQDYGVTRLTWTGTGTAPGFATKRTIGITNTSSVTITRVNAATARVNCATMNTAAVQVGDWVRFEPSTDSFTSLFSQTNQRSWRVLATGVGTIDLLDNGAMALDSTIVLGASFDKQMRVFSNGPMKVGDTVEIIGASQNPNNVGQFQVTDLACDYVQFTNPFACDVVFTNTQNVQAYDRLIGFLYVRSMGEVSMKVNDGAPIKLARLGSNEAFFIGCVQAYKVELVNETSGSVSATVHHASVV